MKFTNVQIIAFGAYVASLEPETSLKLMHLPFIVIFKSLCWWSSVDCIWHDIEDFLPNMILLKALSLRGLDVSVFAV